MVFCWSTFHLILCLVSFCLYWFQNILQFWSEIVTSVPLREVSTNLYPILIFLLRNFWEGQVVLIPDIIFVILISQENHTPCFIARWSFSLFPDRSSKLTFLFSIFFMGQLWKPPSTLCVSFWDDHSAFSPIEGSNKLFLYFVIILAS